MRSEQVRGSKRFLLSPPTEFRSLFPYPHLHASDRQSQLNLSKPVDVNRFPRFRKPAKTKEVILREGQMVRASMSSFSNDRSKDFPHSFHFTPYFLQLFIPAYWWHQVEGLTSVSVAVNVWSPSRAGLVNGRLGEAIPSQLMEKSTDPSKLREQVALLVEYVRRLVASIAKRTASDKVSTGSKKAGFVREVLLERRYRPLYDKLHCSNDLDPGDPDNVSGFNAELCPVQGVEEPLFVEEDLRPWLAAAEKELGAIPDLASPSKSRRKWAMAIRDTLLADFIERLAYHVVGMEHVCIFLRCLAHPASWSQEHSQ